MKQAIWIVVALAALGGGAWWWLSRPKGEAAPVAYKTAALSQGQATQTIRATGTIEPEDLIDIGAQITGQIMAFGTDVDGREVDYCSVVKKGQLLARIDDVTYKAEVTIAKATLASAEAQLASAKADVTQGTASLRQAERDWARAQKLGVGAALSQKDYDAYQSAYEVAAANLDVSKAQVAQAEAAIAQAQAQLEKAERNLSYCDILSTVDGVVIDRRVNIGQTVTASMSTPSLFLVAKVGQEVRFTVDAFPDKNFTGTVGRIRLNASMTSNVVTYTVEVTTDNPDGLLLPYLTANVSFVLAESAPDALLAPVAATRWRPEGWVAPPELAGKDLLFVQDAQGRPRAVPVTLGVSDDVRVAVTAEDLAPGDAVITGTMTPIEVQQASAAGKNPFLPQPPQRRRPR